MSGLFITGGTGFIGRRVLAELRTRGAPRVICLARDRRGLAEAGMPPGWQVVEGDLGDPGSYRAVLEPGLVVLHLAAATGRASAAAQRDVNVGGTRALLRTCEERGTGRFVYVSSIAARFRDRRHYVYAESKREAEALVRQSGLDHVILRPTMVLGEGSPVMTGLRKLATGPALLQIGAGRVAVQPVHVDDLARVIADIVLSADALPELIEIGGPEVLEMRELLRRVRFHARRRQGPVVRIPLNLLRFVVASLEPLAQSRLPVSAGQLASFVNDGTAEPAEYVRVRQPEFHSLEDMIAA